jgi:hypothetical protein
MNSPEVPTRGRDILLARVVERCAVCRTERARGSSAECRCGTAARWEPLCTRCVKAFAGEICPSCLAVAETNGRSLRLALDATLAKSGGLAATRTAFTKASERADATMREFAIRQVVTPIPEWAARLADRNIALPPGADRSRSKMAAINDLRLEVSSVRLALSNLGYSGAPTDEKVARNLEAAREALALLESWDGLSAGADHEARLKHAADAFGAALSTLGILLETVRRRDLSPLIEAVVRRDRAVRAAQQALGVG